MASLGPIEIDAPVRKTVGTSKDSLATPRPLPLAPLHIEKLQVVMQRLVRVTRSQITPE